MSTEGARNVLQKQNKKSFSCQRFQHTKKKTVQMQSADKHHGFNEEDHQLNQFTKL